MVTVVGIKIAKGKSSKAHLADVVYHLLNYNIKDEVPHCK